MTPHVVIIIDMVDLTADKSSSKNLSVLVTNICIAGSAFRFFSLSSSVRKDSIYPSKYIRISKCCWTCAQSAVKKIMWSN